MHFPVPIFLAFEDWQAKCRSLRWVCYGFNCLYLSRSSVNKGARSHLLLESTLPVYLSSVEVENTSFSVFSFLLGQICWRREQSQHTAIMIRKQSKAFPSNNMIQACEFVCAEVERTEKQSSDLPLVLCRSESGTWLQMSSTRRVIYDLTQRKRQVYGRVLSLAFYDHSENLKMMQKT